MNKKIPALVNAFCVLMLLSMPGYALPLCLQAMFFS